MRAPELLAPAGSLQMMQTAFAFGADAVYAGQPRYSLRVRNNSFSRLETLAEGIALARAAGKTFYLVSNIYPHNAKVRTFVDDLRPIIALRPDALIMADPGLMLLVRENWPEMPIHLSVQANTTNYAAVRFWQQMGVERIILSRELSLDEIRDIRQACPEMELEVFVHGALCIAYSGRCLLSGYFNHRDPNQGTCTNSCRWQYRFQEQLPAHEQPATAKSGWIEEATRCGEQMPIEEDEHGTYILNSKDLRAIEHVAQLVEIGVDSLKIEGRTKSPYYVARTCQSYRRAIEDACAGRPFDEALLTRLDALANRGYTDGFYRRHYPVGRQQNYERGHSQSAHSQLVGEVVAFNAERNLAEVEVKNRFALGDELEFLYPEAVFSMPLARLEDVDGNAIKGVPGSGYRVFLPLPAPLTKAACFISKRYYNAAPQP